MPLALFYEVRLVNMIILFYVEVFLYIDARLLSFDRILLGWLCTCLHGKILVALYHIFGWFLCLTLQDT